MLADKLSEKKLLHVEENELAPQKFEKKDQGKRLIIDQKPVENLTSLDFGLDELIGHFSRHGFVLVLAHGAFASGFPDITGLTLRNLGRRMAVTFRLAYHWALDFDLRVRGFCCGKYQGLVYLTRSLVEIHFFHVRHLLCS